MTTLASHALDPDQLDLLSLVADTETPLGQDDADRFEAACRAVAVDGWVNPSDVRAALMVDGELQIEPRRYAALWSASAGRDGFLDVHREFMVPITGDGSRGNGNKSVPMRRLRTHTSAAPFPPRGRPLAPTPPPGASGHLP